MCITASLARDTRYPSPTLLRIVHDSLLRDTTRSIARAKMTTVIPQVKVDHVSDVNIKDEAGDVDMPSPYADDDEDGFEDAGDLDFSQAQQQLWLSHVPRSLWEALSKLNEDDEIDLGRIRVEGPDDQPTRVCVADLQQQTIANIFIGRHAPQPTATARRSAQRVRSSTAAERESKESSTWTGTGVLREEPPGLQDQIILLGYGQ